MNKVDIIRTNINWDIPNKYNILFFWFTKKAKIKKHSKKYLGDICPINKTNKGYYIYLQFDIDSKKLENINKSLNLNESIIRHLAVKVEKHEKLPTIMTQQKN